MSLPVLSSETLLCLLGFMAIMLVSAGLLLFKTRLNHRLQLALLNEKLLQLQQTLSQTEQQKQQLEQELQLLRDIYTDQSVEIGTLRTRLEETQSASYDKQQLLIQSEQRLTQQFENLAHRIFEQRGQKLEQQSRQSLDLLLTPLKEQLDGFKKQVQDSFGQEAKERHTLTFEIRNLQQLNNQMSKEAANLTKALKGNNKLQGNWGEVILNQILSSSGLREGHEFETQVSLNNENHQRLQPDVLVHLPQGNNIIIDAKMTLIAYERFFNSEEPAQQEQALTEHLVAIRSHIRQLSQKNYHKLVGANTLDYVLMFIPIEPAFLLAIEKAPDLINEALQQNIMLVSPSTLLITLRTINNFWRYEYQDRNAQQIADKASKLYDKMRGFIEDMTQLGNGLSKNQLIYQNAMNKLSQGRGNVIAQIEQFRELGVEVKKPISDTLLDSAKHDADIKPYESD